MDEETPLKLTALSNDPHSVLATIFPPVPRASSGSFVNVEISSIKAALVPVPKMQPTRQSPTRYDLDSKVPTV